MFNQKSIFYILFSNFSFHILIIFFSIYSLAVDLVFLLLIWFFFFFLLSLPSLVLFWNIWFSFFLFLPSLVLFLPSLVLVLAYLLSFYLIPIWNSYTFLISFSLLFLIQLFLRKIPYIYLYVPNFKIVSSICHNL